MTRKRSISAIILTGAICIAQYAAAAQASHKIEDSDLRIQANDTTGSFTVEEQNGPLKLTAGIAAKINGTWLHSSDYPKHATIASTENPHELTITHSGLAGQPELICRLSLHSNPSYAELAVDVRNSTGKEIQIQAIRSVEVRDPGNLVLGGSDTANRILSDSFSEDRPAMSIHDFGYEAGGLYRGVGSQLIYNRESRQSIFIAALTSDRWLTVLRLHAQPQSKIAAYEVESTGTTELELENSLRASPPEDRVELSLPLAPSQTLPAEKLMIALGSDYHAQLESYGRIIRDLHHARVSAPTPIGWWSWTAYYFGLNQGAALTNAHVLSDQLKDLGYNFFHIDEGYQYARGEYTTENDEKFPDGMASLESKVQRLGLTPGIWTAPFEVSERSSVYEKHKDWLVHNAHGQPIHAGYVIGGKKKLDQLYILDTTNPGAQNYLRETYSTLAHDWGIRYIKLDFMDDSAIEGYYFKPHTTAMEAQRIGLRIIRDAVGEDVLLDKDGSAMLNPVGIVDCGRISQDTGHTFASSHDAATGVAARYYMNRNFFVGDPDAFSVSQQTLEEQEWHGGKRPLSLDEARVSIALSAISGGMYEIGDDLSILFSDTDRMALVKNKDLINMARLGRASFPVDLMTYALEDEMPSIFVLHESKRQTIVTVFNWTEKERQHQLNLSDFGLAANSSLELSDVLSSGAPEKPTADSISLTLPPRSVRMVKIVDTSMQPATPDLEWRIPQQATVGQSAHFSAGAKSEDVGILQYRWDFGDGATSDHRAAEHTFTHSGTFHVSLTAAGIDGEAFRKDVQVAVTGSFDTRFDPNKIHRRTAARH